MGSDPARLEHAIDVGSFNSPSRMGSEHLITTALIVFAFSTRKSMAADFRAEVTAAAGGVQGDAA